MPTKLSYIFFTKMPSASLTLVFRRSLYTTAVRISRMLLLPREQACINPS
uniref:Uncharacterized protein n=1 Tax=Zea mays TaxID=4577 RepID=C0PIF6_MAIZE|nr:unknown [Zea mays]